MNTLTKNIVLTTLANLIDSNRYAILEANKADVDLCAHDDTSLLDRLKVDDRKITNMISGLQQAIGIDDIVGNVLYTHNHPNGISIVNKVVPFGKVLIIYESRPDVTIEAATIAFKAGNKIFLKGGKESKHTNLVLVDLWHQALRSHGQSIEWVTYLELSREDTQNMIQNNTYNVDLIIPRGGEGLIQFVRQNTHIPIIISGRGNNFMFIDRTADLSMALEIMVNAKQRISVCNALDKVLIHRNIPNYVARVQEMIDILRQADIEVLFMNDVNNELSKVEHTIDKGLLSEEFLAAKILLSPVDDLDQAVEWINTYSGGHSATIITDNVANAEIFQDQVDCAAVYHNASTRFTDGGEFGFGAEIAISTQKLHFRGPIGIHQLVTNKWFVSGNGQTR